MAILQMYGTASDSIVDGPGLRYSVFVQGCSHHCEGCHNPESQPFEGGFPLSVEDLVRDIEANKLVSGVTLTGGEPFEQCEACLELAKTLSEKGYDLWVYSGYLFEDLLAGHPHDKAKELLSWCDVLVDGPFVRELNSYDLKWKGSSNQRVIDLKESFRQEDVVLWSQDELDFEIPQSW